MMEGEMTMEAGEMMAAEETNKGQKSGEVRKIGDENRDIGDRPEWH